MRAVATAGELVVVDCPLPWLMRLLTDGTGGERAGATDGGARVRLELKRSRQPFDHDGWALVGRGSWASPPSALLTDACSSGFDLRIEPRGETLGVAARYRPAARTRAANVLLPTRFKLLATQTLLHYPALWWASVRGRVPLHVSVTAGAASVTMIAGAGGVGKSTLLAAGLEHGEIATADNVFACDERSAYGLAEPLSVTADTRRPSAMHGRIERQLPGRVTLLVPDRLVVLSRLTEGRKDRVGPLSAAEAARTLVARAYMAGEVGGVCPF